MASANTTVDKFLESIGLSNYTGRFLSQGYESFEDLVLLEESDLDTLMISDVAERKAILNAVGDIAIEEWLDQYRLKDYIDGFFSEGIRSIKDLKKCDITEDLIERLEIMVPGHRKRFLASADALKRRQSKDRDSPEPAVAILCRPVAMGCWDKCLPPSNSHFLCVQGFLRPTTQGDRESATTSEPLLFTVDSGSEVVTARQEIIDSLGLEYIQTVPSQGIHSRKDMPLYRGDIRVGKSHWIEVEVMPETFESLGVSVIRQFCHVINGHFHRWTIKESEECAPGTSTREQEESEEDQTGTESTDS